MLDMTHNIVCAGQMERRPRERIERNGEATLSQNHIIMRNDNFIHFYTRVEYVNAVNH